MIIKSTLKASDQSNQTEAAVTYIPQEKSPEKAKTIQEEHLLALKEIKKSISEANAADAEEGTVPVLVGQIGSGLSLPLTWKLVNIPRQATAQEIASELIAVGADPEAAITFAQNLIDKISDPNIRNIIVSAVAGLAAFTFIYRLKIALWLKVGVGIVAFIGLFYLLTMFFPNATEQKPDEPPTQESVEPQ